MISTGEFREDLFYRLNVINVQVPALKDRKEDIPLLVNHFLKNNAQSSKTSIKKTNWRSAPSTT